MSRKKSKINIETILVGSVILLLVGFVLVDRLLVAKYEPVFKELETQRIITSNKLASAKIVYENLNHVRDLVEKNMIFPGQVDSASLESIFFDFITTSVNDLKMKLVSCRPVPPVVSGNITTYGYQIELEGDFFSLGELCAKFENSRRIINVSSFAIGLVGGSSSEKESFTTSPANKGITISMHVNAFRIRKG
jgi:hypothetical protein